MKKILLFIALLFLPIFAHAESDVINNFDMTIYIDNNGTAHVTETWDATANMGSEFYRSYYNYGNSEFGNFTVTMDGKDYTFTSNWNIDASLKDKEYKNGFNYVTNGIEICFGKTSMGRHTYVSKYTITNFLVETSDSQVLYWTLLPYNNGGQFQAVHIKIYSDTKYNSDLPVWGYGNYGGTAYVYDGFIEMTSDGVLDNDEYMTLLVKYPLGTFTNITTKDTSSTFNDYYEMAEEGSTEYEDVDSSNVWWTAFLGIFQPLFIICIVVLIFNHASKTAVLGDYRLDFGKRGKKIDKEIPNYREIPCKKNIYDAYFISLAFDICKKKTDLLGAILLKWIKEDKIATKKVTTKILKKEELAIDLKDSTFDNPLEQKLYNMMKEASEDGILEKKEFERWCNEYYTKILNWFDKVLNETGEKFENNKFIVHKDNRVNKYDVADDMFDEAKKLKGLKQYLLEFSRIGEKEPIEVKMWEEYLMFAQIFGIAEEVAKQFKKLYPDVIVNKDYNYDTFIFIHTISNSGMISASTAQMRAQSYSAGGGGFSSGGGGGGSFGGGGGGGAGGR